MFSYLATFRGACFFYTRAASFLCGRAFLYHESPFRHSHNRTFLPTSFGTTSPMALSKTREKRGEEFSRPRLFSSSVPTILWSSAAFAATLYHTCLFRPHSRWPPADLAAATQIPLQPSRSLSMSCGCCVPASLSHLSELPTQSSL